MVVVSTRPPDSSRATFTALLVGAQTPTPLRYALGSSLIDTRMLEVLPLPAGPSTSISLAEGSSTNSMIVSTAACWSGNRSRASSNLGCIFFLLRSEQGRKRFLYLLLAGALAEL